MGMGIAALRFRRTQKFIWGGLTRQGYKTDWVVGF